MAIHSCNYPVVHKISNQSQDRQDYTVSVNGTVIFSGRIYFKSNTLQTEELDISNLCQEYLDVFYEDITYPVIFGTKSLPRKDNVGSIVDFVVTDHAGSQTYKVMYDYNTEYVSQWPDMGVLREPITNEVDQRQFLPVTGYSASDNIGYSFSTSTGMTGSGTGEANNFSLFMVNAGALNISTGDTITMVANGKAEVYNVVRPCGNKYAVYYVNKYGGLEALLCSGRATEKWNRKDVDVRLYNDRANPYGFDQRSLITEIDHSFSLHTGFIPHGNERRIDNLINTTKLWLHDLETGFIFAAQITDSSFSAQEVRYDKLFRYNFNVKKSQKQIRK